MLSKLLTFLVLLPLALLLVVFSVLNRAPVTLSMDVFGTTPQLAVQAQLFVVVLTALIIGVILGGIGTFMTQAHHRRRAARKEREVEHLRQEAAVSKERVRAMREERERAAAASSATPATGIGSAPRPGALPAPRAA